MLVSMIGLAGCVDGPGYYGSYGYPGYYSSYNGGPWWGYGHEGFHQGGHFDHNRWEGHAFSPYRFGGRGFHNGPAIAHGGGFRGGFGGGHFGGGRGHR
jgi:hypothetical protein